MRPAGRAFVQQIINTKKIIEPIYEFGASRVRGQEELADLRPLFKNKLYVGTDMSPGPGVDLIIDMEKMKLPDNCIGTAISIDTLEHVKNVYKATDEIYRVLKPGGIIIISSVMLFPIHCHPNDYWRFTPAAFELLLKKFKEKKVWFDGDARFPTGIYGFGIK